MATITDTVNKPAADRNLWLRLLFSLFYFVIGFYVVKVIMAVIVIMQFIFELLQGVLTGAYVGLVASWHGTKHRLCCF